MKTCENCFAYSKCSSRSYPEHCSGWSTNKIESITDTRLTELEAWLTEVIFFYGKDSSLTAYGIGSKVAYQDTLAKVRELKSGEA